MPQCESWPISTGTSPTHLDDEDFELTEAAKSEFREAVKALGSATEAKEEETALGNKLKKVQEEADPKISAKVGEKDKTLLSVREFGLEAAIDSCCGD